MLGLHPKSAVSTRDLWRSLVHPDDISQMDHLLKTTIMNPAGADFALELRVMHSSGHYIWVLNKGAVFERTGDGHPLRVVGTHMDITEAKLAALKTQEDQKVLQENQRQLQDVAALPMSCMTSSVRPLPPSRSICYCSSAAMPSRLPVLMWKIFVLLKTHCNKCEHWRWP
jgi:PAS domain S-box-containing protein